MIQLSLWNNLASLKKVRMRIPLLRCCLVTRSMSRLAIIDCYTIHLHICARRSRLLHCDAIVIFIFLDFSLCLQSSQHRRLSHSRFFRWPKYISSSVLPAVIRLISFKDGLFEISLKLSKESSPIPQWSYQFFSISPLKFSLVQFPQFTLDHWEDHSHNNIGLVNREMSCFSKYCLDLLYFLAKK